MSARTPSQMILPLRSVETRFLRSGVVSPLAGLLGLLAFAGAMGASPAPPAPSSKVDEKPSSTPPNGQTVRETVRQTEQTAAAGLRADLVSSAAWCDAVRAFTLAARERAIKDGELGSGSLFKAASRSLELLAGHYREGTSKLPVESAPPAPPAPPAVPAPPAPLAVPAAQPNGKTEGKAAAGTPASGLVIPEIKSSAENLRALAGLMAARRSGQLTEMAARWRTAPHRQSSQVFRFEREASTELGRFATEAAEQPERVRKLGKTFYISRPCGYVINQLSADRCPVCKASRDTFEKSE